MGDDGGLRQALVVALVAGGVAFVWATCRERGGDDEDEPSGAPYVYTDYDAGPDGARARSPMHGSDALRRAALDAPAALPTELGSSPCHLGYEAPMPLGRQRVSPLGDPRLEALIPRDFDSALREHLLIGGWRFDVAPGVREGVGPLRARVHMDAWVDDAREWTRGGTFPALVVDEWIDPILPAYIGPEGATFVSGRLRGRVLLWSYSDVAFVCGAQVDAENTSLTVVHVSGLSDRNGLDDDPLTKARIDLVIEAMRQGAERLVAVASPSGP